MELNMAKKGNSNIFSKAWLWITLWLVFIANAFQRSYGFQPTQDHETITITFEPSPAIKASELDLPTTNKTTKPDTLDDIKAFRQTMENQVLKHLIDYIIDSYNDQRLTQYAYQEILNRFKTLKESNPNIDTVIEQEQTFILLMLNYTLSNIETLESIHTLETDDKEDNESERLFSELLALERQLDTIFVSDLIDQEDLSNNDSLEYSDNEYDQDKLFMTEDELENVFDTHETISTGEFNLEYLLAKIQVRLETLSQVDQLLIKNKDDVYESLISIQQKLDIQHKEVLNISVTLDQILNAHFSNGLQQK